MPATTQREFKIEDLRSRPTDTETLRNLLESGTPFIPDPKRNGFYEVESGSLVYYIHVSPVTGNVFLLAEWPRDAERSGKNQAA
jgi:hypothetical protein